MTRPSSVLEPSQVPCYMTYEKKEVPDRTYTETLQKCVRQGTKNLAGYFKGRVRSLSEIFARDALIEPEPPIDETHELVDATPEQAVEQEVMKVWKHKADTSKLVTRDDGHLYQCISQYAPRCALATPRGTSNMMEATSHY